MSDCNSDCQPSLYEQHCCNLRNIRNIFEFKDGKIHTNQLSLQPTNVLFPVLYNYSSCVQIHQLYSDATLGYYNIILANRTLFSTYSLNYNKVCKHFTT